MVSDKKNKYLSLTVTKKMTQNKILNFLSDTEVKPILRCLHYKDDYVEATDSLVFARIFLPKNTPQELIINPFTLDIFNVEEIEMYPNCDKIIPELENDKAVDVSLDEMSAYPINSIKENRFYTIGGYSYNTKFHDKITALLKQEIKKTLSTLTIKKIVNDNGMIAYYLTCDNSVLVIALIMPYNKIS